MTPMFVMNTAFHLFRQDTDVFMGVGITQQKYFFNLQLTCIVYQKSPKQSKLWWNLIFEANLLIVVPTKELNFICIECIQ